MDDEYYMLTSKYTHKKPYVKYLLLCCELLSNPTVFSHVTETLQSYSNSASVSV